MAGEATECQNNRFVQVPAAEEFGIVGKIVSLTRGGQGHRRGEGGRVKEVMGWRCVGEVGDGMERCRRNAGGDGGAGVKG